MPTFTTKKISQFIFVGILKCNAVGDIMSTKASSNTYWVAFMTYIHFKKSGNEVLFTNITSILEMFIFQLYMLE